MVDNQPSAHYNMHNLNLLNYIAFLLNTFFAGVVDSTVRLGPARQNLRTVSGSEDSSTKKQFLGVAGNPA